MAETVAYYFLVTSNRNQYFECAIEYEDGAKGGSFQCKPMSDGTTVVQFEGGVSIKNEMTLEEGTYYKLSVTDDFHMLLSEYAEDGKVRRLLMDFPLERCCPDFALLQEKKPLTSQFLHFTAGSSIQQVTADAEGRILQAGEETAAQTQTEDSAAEPTTTLGKETAPAEGESHGGAVFGVLIVLLVLAAAGVMVWRRMQGGRGKAARRFDDAAEAPVTVKQQKRLHASIPLDLDISSAEWEKYLERARRDGKCPVGMTIAQYAASLARIDLAEKKPEPAPKRSALAAAEKPQEAAKPQTPPPSKPQETAERGGDWNAQPAQENSTGGGKGFYAFGAGTFSVTLPKIKGDEFEDMTVPKQAESDAVETESAGAAQKLGQWKYPAKEQSGQTKRYTLD